MSKEDKIKESLVQDIDGFWKFWPNTETGGGYFTEGDLIEICTELRKLNKEWEEEVNSYFEQDKKK